MSGTWGGTVGRISEDLQSTEIVLRLDRTYDSPFDTLPLPRAGSVYYLLDDAEFFRLTKRNDPNA